MTDNLPATTGTGILAQTAAPKTPQIITKADGTLDFEAMTGFGFENVNETRDILIPRLAILQALSPQCTRNKPEYMPDARPGDICDTATGTIFPQPLKVVAVDYMVSYLEWAPRASNKGLVGIYADGQLLPETRPDERGRAVTSAGNLLVESRQFFCLLPEHGNRRVFIPMSSTQAKKAKKWVTSMRAEKFPGTDRVVPLFYRVQKLSSFGESNAEGSWEGWKIEPGDAVRDLPNAKETMQAISSFFTVLKSGQTKAQHMSEDEVPF
jgi:hypothetical protein